jgi:hypothetical protein
MVRKIANLVNFVQYVRVFVYLTLMILRVGAANVQTHLGKAYVSTKQEALQISIFSFHNIMAKKSGNNCKDPDTNKIKNKIECC